MVKEINVDADIKFAQRLINTDKIIPVEYHYNSSIYKFTNEPINRYVNYLKNNNKILSVTSSGDQIFNSILYGTTQIDSFDISRFPRYYVELKKAAILSLSKKEFISFFINTKNNSRQKLIDMYNYLKMNMDDNYQEFWDTIFKRNGVARTFLSNLFNSDTPIYTYFNNPYLQDNNYKKLQNNLRHVEIEYIVDDIKKLVAKLDKDNKYDMVNLSNIISSTKLRDYKQIIESLPVKENGTVISYVPQIDIAMINNFYQKEYTFDYLDKNYGDGVIVYTKRNRAKSYKTIAS